MTIKWTPEGKVDRSGRIRPSDYNAVAKALDVAVAALRWYADPIAHVFPDMGKAAKKALRKIGVDDDAR